MTRCIIADRIFGSNEGWIEPTAVLSETLWVLPVWEADVLDRPVTHRSRLEHPIIAQISLVVLHSSHTFNLDPMLPFFYILDPEFPSTPL